jgi:hypothetical protein
VSITKFTIAMMFQDFYKQYRNCLICKEDLETFASFVFLIRRYGQIEVAGDILYTFDPGTYRFLKENCNPVYDGHEDMALYLDEAYDKLSDGFNPLTKTFPRIGQSKLQKLITSRWHLSSIGLTYSKCCANDGHYFSYEAETIFGRDEQSYVPFVENLEVHDININNLYSTNNTMISSKKLGMDFSMPSLPINQWDTSSKSAFINQVYRYAILQ